MKRCVVLIFAGVASGTAWAASLLQPVQFPKTVDDIKWSDRMDILAEDYENYAGLSPYQQLILDEVEAESHSEVAAENAAECALTGQACDIDTPISDGSTYYAFNNVDDVNGNNNNAGGANTQGVYQFSNVAQNQNVGSQVATGYCSVQQSEIPRGQKIPLGSPVRLDDLPMGASDKSNRIAANSRNGMFCSPYGCREKYNKRGEFRPHQGIDIGCTADYFGMPIYTPADGTVVQVWHDRPGKSAGNYIRIKHADGWETQYMHLEKIFVSKGQHVSAGCAIGTLGHSGGNADSTNPTMGKDMSHLHYEIIYNGTASSVQLPNGRSVRIIRGGNMSCGNFKAKIKPDDFVTYYYK